jgi:hypothetical protein
MGLWRCSANEYRMNVHLKDKWTVGTRYASLSYSCKLIFLFVTAAWPPIVRLKVIWKLDLILVLNRWFFPSDKNTLLIRELQHVLHSEIQNFATSFFTAKGLIDVPLWNLMDSGNAWISLPHLLKQVLFFIRPEYFFAVTPGYKKRIYISKPKVNDVSCVPKWTAFVKTFQNTSVPNMFMNASAIPLNECSPFK